MTVRVRFAPSPTGHYHIGSARTALFNYLYARRHGGTFILRIEDTDNTRNREGAERGFIEAMHWLGLQWDEGVEVGGPHAPYRSMERLSLYSEHANQLLAAGKAYRCYCTAAELEEEHQRQVERGVTPRYSGRCRRLTERERQALERENREFTVRFAVNDGDTVAFDDQIRGRVEFSSDDIGDFIIVKSDGVPVYNFACMVDDGLMRITHVIRGEEHLSNTPRQILIGRALGFDIPVYAHLPLILREDGKKLSKRDESIVQFIEQYRELGYLPQAILNYLALLGWSPGSEEELFSLEDLSALFSLERVHRSGAVFDRAKLDWMNGMYLRQLPNEQLTSMGADQLVRAGAIQAEDALTRHEWLTELMELYRDHLAYVAELPALVSTFFESSICLDEEAAAVLEEETSLPVLKAATDAFRSVDTWDVEHIQRTIKEVGAKVSAKGRTLFMPIRCSVTGHMHGPDLLRTLKLLGQPAVVGRIREVVVSLEASLG